MCSLWHSEPFCKHVISHCPRGPSPFSVAPVLLWRLPLVLRNLTNRAELVTNSREEQLLGFLPEDHGYTTLGIVALLVASFWPTSIANYSDSWHTLVLVSSLNGLLFLILALAVLATKRSRRLSPMRLSVAMNIDFGIPGTSISTRKELSAVDKAAYKCTHKVIHMVMHMQNII